MNIPDEIWLKTVNKNNMKGSIIDSHICALENLGQHTQLQSLPFSPHSFMTMIMREKGSLLVFKAGKSQTDKMQDLKGTSKISKEH